MTDADLKKLATYIAAELRKNPVPKVRKRRPCGTGARMPECWGSTIYGPKGCYCR